MKLISEVGNLGALKVLIAGNVVKTRIEIHKVSQTDGVTKLPSLVISSETTLFSPNASVWYLFASVGKNVKAQDDEWLGWESTHLQPLLAHFIQQVLTKKNVEPGVQKALGDCLDKLEKSLGKTLYFGGNEVNVVDICLWSSLFPVFTETKDKLVKDLQQKPLVAKWFASCANLPAFKEALAAVIKGNGLEACKDSFSTLPPLKLTFDGPSKTEPAAKNSQEVEAAKEKEVPVTPEEIETVTNAWSKGISDLSVKETQEVPVEYLKNKCREETYKESYRI